MSKRVLLVEDEPNIIEAITFLLSRDGWHVDTHVDGATAVERVHELSPDLLMLDHMLPGKSGLDILTELRSDTAYESLPILMLTARGQMRDRTQAEEAGVSRFMTKPFSNTEVLNAVRALMHT
jgi:DNA-binding response OmpR family regulator